MSAFNIWGNVGNAAYAIPMVKLTPFDPTTAQLLGWNPTEQALDYVPFTVDPATGDVALSGNISLAAAKVMSIAGQQVMTSRRTGWVPATGGTSRATFDTAAVTLPQLAERVKALLDDLTTHGLIGA
jgi:hypothetical protein